MTKNVVLCTDLCEHCSYIEEGDFICQITNDVTIVSWKPFPCCCPKRRRSKMTREQITNEEWEFGE